MSSPRKTALKILESIEQGGYLNLVLKDELKGMDERDRRFVTALCHTVIENEIKIDYIINSFTENKRIHRVIRNILRMGVAQLMFMDGVPQSAAVNECVKLTESTPKRQLKGFVNAVLRKIARERENIAFPKREDGEVKYLSVNYSYPEWLCEMYLSDYGFDFTEKMLAYKNDGAMTCVRANSLKGQDAEKLSRRLTGAAFKVYDGKYCPDALYIKNITAVDELKMYKKGELTVQQESSMLAVRCADIREGMNVIDVCAAPGGKSAIAAQNFPKRLVAMELHPHRAELMKKNFERLGVNAQVMVHDAAAPISNFYEKFDRVLADVPCSALGLLYRKPDIKLSKKREEIDELTRIQADILETASRYLKKDGRLLYSTCTIDRRENGDIIDAFLKKHPNFKSADISKDLPESLRERAQDGRIQLFPQLDGIDGFFIAALERIK